MKHKLFFITGAQGSGKTTFIKKLATLMTDAGHSCGGFYAEGYWENDLRSGFDIVQIDGGKRELLCNTMAVKGDEPFRRFFFKKEGLDFGNRILEEAEGKDLVLFIDEVGALELEGRGWASAIEKLNQTPAAIMIWTIRENIEERISARFGVIPDALWNINFTTPENVFKAILKISKQ
jgi:nucleoside-triphosphatase